MIVNAKNISYSRQQKQKVSFQSALTKLQMKAYKETSHLAKQALGTDMGSTHLILHDPSLPQIASENTGIGKIASDMARKCIGFLHDITGFNVLQFLPQGKLFNKHPNNFFCPYQKASGTTLSNHLINLKELTKKEYGCLVKNSEFEEIVKKNNIPNKDTYINYENEIGEKAGNSSKLLREKVYSRFIAGNTPELKKLQKEFEQFKINEEYRFERLSLPEEVLRKNRHLFENYDENIKEINKLKEVHKEEVDFYKFEQFLADRALMKEKKYYNAQGIETCGDIAAGFDDKEVLAYPKAFDSGKGMGFGLPAFKYNSDGSLTEDSAKMLEMKFKFYLKRYDKLRLDMGWSYVQPVIDGQKIYSGDKTINLIESIAKKVKGPDYDLSKISYEVEAGGETFNAFNWYDSGPQSIGPLKNRMKIFSTEWESGDGHGWASYKFMKNAQLHDDEFIIGSGTHDTTPLRQIAENPEQKDKKGCSIHSLHLALGIPHADLQAPKAFVKAKFAEPALAKHNFFFLNDVLGIKDRINLHNTDTKNFRIKISENFEEQYHKTLQEGHGYNQMEALGMAMKRNGLDQSHQSVYEKVIYFAKKLREKGPLTQAEAETQAKVQIEKETSKVKVEKPQIIEIPKKQKAEETQLQKAETPKQPDSNANEDNKINNRYKINKDSGNNNLLKWTAGITAAASGLYLILRDKNKETPPNNIEFKSNNPEHIASKATNNTISKPLPNAFKQFKF